MREKVDVAVDAHAVLGEGPSWDERDGSLLWVDIERFAVHRYSPISNQDESFTVGQQVGAVVPRTAGGLLLAIRDGFASVDSFGGPLEFRADVERDITGNRMNDGKCDPAGRFWAGTMDLAEVEYTGALYRFDVDHTVHRVVTDIGISNGLGWNLDRTLMYYIDTSTGGVDVFDYDLETGEVRHRRRLIDIPAEVGLPDGMTVDAESYLWVALWGGWGLRRYSPQGELEREVNLPVSKVTSCCFGGQDLADLYITSASIDLSPEQRTEQPHAGGLFVCRPGVTGQPTYAYGG
jgi:sugar lactone lactonase YvrE